jgi:7-keto-8-aminopelargonate synthetase-like enzyme
LWQRVAQFQKLLEARAPQFRRKVESPIVPLVVGSSEGALRLSGKLFDNGLWVTAIRPPTVPEGTARLRLTMMATHSEADIERLAICLGD